MLVVSCHPFIILLICYTQLGLKYLDLYLIHLPTSAKNNESNWKEFEKIKKDGLAK